MIINYIQEIIQAEKLKGSNELYIRSAIKEYLQILVLQFIYTNSDYKSSLIFTGGTCLRHFYGLERLSEDLDFDKVNYLNVEKLASDIQEYFVSSLQYKDLQISIKQQGKQILLKLPILRNLGLATESDSDLLYVKSDISEILGKSYKTEKTAKSAFGYNFVALHYDLPSLFAGKITAILTRNLLTGRENSQTIKGRDFYDLLWYLKKGVRVNLQLVREKLNESELDIASLNLRISEKVNLACTKNKSNFKTDLIPFITNPGFVTDYVENFVNEMGRYELVEESR